MLLEIHNTGRSTTGVSDFPSGGAILHPNPQYQAVLVGSCQSVGQGRSFPDLPDVILQVR
jgi:hypothetical protein